MSILHRCRWRAQLATRRVGPRRVVEGGFISAWCDAPDLQSGPVISAADSHRIHGLQIRAMVCDGMRSGCRPPLVASETHASFR